MTRTRLIIRDIVIKTIVTHTVTYFIAGLAALAIFDYAHLYAETSLKLLMRQTTEPLVMAGPLLQPIRGLLFGIVFYMLREPFFKTRNGWLVMWMVLIAFGILGTFGPTPSSLEGIIYTVLPLRLHIMGLPETLLQSLLLSSVLFHWVNHPEKNWLNWTMGLAFFLVLLLPTMGLVLSRSR